MEQVSVFARRFQLSGTVSSRAAELYRLAEVKGVRGMSSAGLALACLDISSTQLGETFDKVQAQKLSGLQPRAYSRAVQSVGKILNLSTSSISLREMAVRFGCLEAEQLATDTLKNYRGKMDVRYSELQRESLDLSKPLYSAAALYTACRAMKFRSDKAQFQSVGGCPSRSVFQTILDQMKDCVPKKEATEASSSRKRKHSDKTNKTGTTASSEDSQQSQPTRTKDGGVPHSGAASTKSKSKRESLWSRVVSSPLSEDYLQWKEAVLAAAREKIAHSQ